MNTLSLSSSREAAISHMEIGYSEALRVFWRLFWPVMLVTSFVIFLLTLGLIAVLKESKAMTGATLILAAAQWSCFYVCTAVFVGRIFSRPFRGFSIKLTGPAGGPSDLTGALRTRLAFYLVLRLFIVNLVMGFAIGLLNIVLAMFPVYLGSNWVLALTVFAAGPFAVKMLIGERLDGTRIEVEREAPLANVAAAGSLR